MLSIINLNAQNQPYLGSFNYNWQVINPGAIDKLLSVDSDLPYVLSVMARTQSLGIEGAPQTYFVSGEYRPVKDGFNLKLGGSILYDKTDVFSSIVVTPNIGVYRSDQGRTIYVGLSPSLSRNQLNISELKFKDQSDLNALSTRQNPWQSNIGIGTFYKYRRRFYTGVSLPGVLQFSEGKKVVNPYLNLVSGYYHRFAKNWRMEPALWVRYIPNLQFLTFANQRTPVSTDVNLRFLRFPDRAKVEQFWGGIGFGMSQNLRLECGFLFTTGNLGTSGSPGNRSPDQYYRMSVIANRPVGRSSLSQFPSLEVEFSFAFK